MVQIKQFKNNTKGNNSKPGKPQPKKAQLQFASSDEDSDDELDEEEIDIEDEEFEDEDLEGFEDEDELEDEEEDEEESEGKVPTKAELKAALVNAKGDKKTPQKQDNKATPAAKSEKSPVAGKKGEKPAAAATPKAQQNKQEKKQTETPSKPAAPEKANGVTKNEKGKKRKAEESAAAKSPAAKQSRLGDDDAIVTEETRRREERNKRSLFLKGVGKLVKKNSEIKSLHPDIVSVRSMGINAWALFPNATACDKAFKQLSEKTIKGKKLTVDYCGSKAKNQSQSNKNIDKPINKLALLVAGLPAGTTVEKLKVIFSQAKSIEIPDNKKNTANIAFVHFAAENEAQAAFTKNESLKVGGVPVEVLYARQRLEK